MNNLIQFLNVDRFATGEHARYIGCQFGAGFVSFGTSSCRVCACSRFAGQLHLAETLHRTREISVVELVSEHVLEVDTGLSEIRIIDRLELIRRSALEDLEHRVFISSIQCLRNECTSEMFRTSFNQRFDIFVDLRFVDFAAVGEFNRLIGSIGTSFRDIVDRTRLGRLGCVCDLVARTVSGYRCPDGVHVDSVALVVDKLAIDSLYERRCRSIRAEHNQIFGGVCGTRCLTRNRSAIDRHRYVAGICVDSNGSLAFVELVALHVEHNNVAGVLLVGILDAGGFVGHLHVAVGHLLDNHSRLAVWRRCLSDCCLLVVVAGFD